MTRHKHHHPFGEIVAIGRAIGVTLGLLTYFVTRCFADHDVACATTTIGFLVGMALGLVIGVVSK